MARWILPAAVVAVVAVIAGSLFAGGFFTAPSNSNCTSNSLNHVYNPSRLQVNNACQTVSGTVENVFQEADGDTHIRLQLDQGYANLLNQANYDYQYGTLILEIVCAYPAMQLDAVAACSGYTNPIAIPSVGEHILIVGQYVTDLNHGWNEIHPVYSIQILS